MLNTNLRGYFVCGQTVALHMRGAKIAGTIINISSIRAVQADARVAHYSVTKAAILMLTKQMALEVAPHGIRVKRWGRRDELWIATTVDSEARRMSTVSPGRGELRGLNGTAPVAVGGGRNEGDDDAHGADGRDIAIPP